MPTSRRSVWRSRRRRSGARRQRARIRGARTRHPRLCDRDADGLPGHAGRPRAHRRRARVDIVSMQRGGGSKDVWVLTPDPRPIEDSAARRRSRARKSGTTSCRRDWSRTFIGWAATANAATARRGCCVRAWACAATPRSGRGGRDLPAFRLHARAWRGSDAQRRAAPTLPMFSEANPLGLAADLQRLVWCASAGAQPFVGRELARDRRPAARVSRCLAAQSADPREILDRMLLSLAALAGFRARRHDAG
jgi:hypothetical protein